jgi:hypothetical protein
MYVRRLLYNEYSKYIISVILGLGLATLFRKVCNDRNCLIFKAPNINSIKNKIFKHNNKCYKFNYNSCSCNKNKKIVDFA